MTFTIRGVLDGEEVAVTYDDGRLTGHQEAVARVEQVLDSSDTLRLSPQDRERPATRDDPRAVMAAAEAAFEAVTALEGDYPMPEADDSAS